MTWPIDDISTSALDSQNDRPPRAEFFKLFQRVKTIIAGRGRAGGVASLGADGRVPEGQLPPSATQSVELGVPNGAATLDTNGNVPLGQIPSSIARLHSPALTGSPIAPTLLPTNDSTRIATTAFVQNVVGNRLRNISRYGPEHQWDDTRLRFRNPNGSWGAWTDLRGPPGPPGPPAPQPPNEPNSGSDP